MAKSKQNVIAPEEVIKSYGVEVLRLWVASEDYREDITISDEILKRLSESYRKIRNTCRFLLGNLHDFKPEEAWVMRGWRRLTGGRSTGFISSPARDPPPTPPASFTPSTICCTISASPT